jgi:CRISPR type III-associated protein (TIGR04423 family)
MKERHKAITLADIPVDVVFDGYFWVSNDKKPKTMRAERVDMTLFQKLPFVVEGNLWSEERSLSIQIRNVDGEYLINQFDLSNSDPDQDKLLDEKEYLAHDLDGVGKFRVVEAWKEHRDEMLAGMVTLVPAWTAFKGFVNDKNQAK